MHMVSKRKQTIAVCAFLGSVVLPIAIYATVVRIDFAPLFRTAARSQTWAVAPG